MQNSESNFESAKKLFFLGLSSIENGDYENAERFLLESLELIPERASTLTNLSAAQLKLKKYDFALGNSSKAVALDDSNSEAWLNLGLSNYYLNKTSEALKNIDKAIQLNPDNSEAYTSRGNVLRELGQLDDALLNHEKAIQLKPDNSEAYINRGNVLKELGRLNDALSSHDKAIQLKPNNPEAYTNRGTVLRELGRLNDALSSHEKAIQLNPDCFDAYSNYLMASTYIADFALSDYFEMARRFSSIAVSKATLSLSNYIASTANNRLRVGFVSGDLCNHPVGYFIEGILAHLSNSKIEIISYPTTPKQDSLTKRIKPFFFRWQPICELSDKDAANLIYNDGVHILVDLAGHTAHNRLPMFAWKPAPIQISWLGYFATTGLPMMDYILSDPYLTPSEKNDAFVERIWPLPETRWCFTPPDIQIDVQDLPAERNKFLTFGCFNNFSKLNEQVFELWSKVLHAIPDSRLLLKSKQLAEGGVCSEIMQQFYSRGIASDRIMLEKSESRDKYFAAYNKIDIALDPFPFTGGTTSVEGLWMGVPVITMAGDSLVSRQGVSILENVGLADWIAKDKDDYVNKAVLFSSDLEKLAKLRAALRSKSLSSPLFNAQRFAKNFEGALWQMWKNFENSLDEEITNDC